MNVSVLTSPHDLAAIREQWHALALAVGTMPYASPAWCIPWWNHFGRGRLHVVTVSVDGRLVALAPFHVRSAFGLKVLRFLGHGSGAVSQVLVAAGHADAASLVWPAILDDRRMALELVEYRHGGGGFLELRRAAPSRFAVEVRDLCPVVVATGDFEGYLATRPQRLRRILRRADRFLQEEQLALKVDVLSSPEAVRRALPDVGRIHDAAGPAGSERHALSGSRASFTHEMLDNLARCGCLRLYLATIGDEPAATASIVVGGGHWGYTMPRFDPAYGRFSPGHLMLRSIVGDAFAHGRDLDLLLGDQEYKRLWSTAAYDTLTVRASPSLASWGVTHVAAQAGAGLRAVRERARSVHLKPVVRDRL